MTVPKHPPFLGGPVGRLRRWFWLHIGRYKSELCQDCGGRYMTLIWWAPDELWRTVTGQAWTRQADGRWAFREGDTLVYEDERPTVGLLCPPCFGRRADALGLFIRWRPEVVT